MTMRVIKKAVIPVAGLGTRFLPATKAQPKEMLPLVDKPVIQYVVEEAVRAGVQNVILVTGRGKQAIENHFDVAYELEHTLSQRRRGVDLDIVRSITELANFSYVRQGEPLGLGHAVLCAKHAVGEEPFALLLGDDVFDVDRKALDVLIRVHQDTGSSIVGVQTVPLEHVGRYGIVNGPEQPEERCWKVDRIVEKPSPDKAPSRNAVVGRYILCPEIFERLEALEPGSGAEYQLTDALSVLAEQGKLMAVAIPAKRYDTGDKLDYLRANIEFALKREELGPQLLEYMKSIVSKHD
jgi:UTP--glucose-1-phosphate uridylyltransferase